MSEQTSPLHHDAPAAAQRQPRPFPQVRFDALARDRARTLTVVALIAIVLFGGYLRLTHVNWDDGAHLHPDERFLTQISTETKAPSSILNYFDTDTSKLNPYNIEKQDGSRQTTFVYGTLPLFLNKFVASNLSTLSLGYFDNYDDYDHYNLSGRALAGIFDIGTIVVIFLIGRQLVDRKLGLLAAFLYSVSAFPIQNSHFFVVDPFVTFFAAATVLFAIRSAQRGGYGNFAAAGAAAGLAAACKITAVSLLPVIVLAVGVYSWPAVRPFVAQLWTGEGSAALRYERSGRRLDRAVATFILGSVVAMLAAFVAFRIAMPYAFNAPSISDWFSFRWGHVGPLPFVYPDIMNQAWIRDQVDQQNLLSGEASFPPNVQWIGRARWLWPLQQMVMWGMGPALGIVAWLGVVFAAIYAVRNRAWAWLVPLAWVIGYFGFMGMQYSLYMRYFLPLYPALTLFGAFLLYKTWLWAGDADAFAALGRLRARLEPAAPVVTGVARAGVGLVVLLTLLMGIAFYHIYTQPVTRATASRWIYENVPAGSIIGHEHWDDPVPHGVKGVPAVAYGSVEFQNFNPDTPERVEALLNEIDQSDYIALSSERLSRTIPRVPAAWPITSRYYETLASGELGFEQVAEFSSYPSVFGIELNDRGAEESYSVYDHPYVVIYKKTDAYAPERARKVLGADAFIAGVQAKPGDLGNNAIRFKPDVLAEQKAGGTWRDIFNANGFVNDHPLFFWLLAMELAAFSLVPIAVVVFRGLPDRGFLLTKPLGVLTLSYLVYAPSSYGLTDFTRTTIAVALALMVAAGIAAALRWHDEVLAFARERWRFIIFAQCVFLLAFIFAYWLRLQNPDLWHPARGGEKPMDFAYLNGVIRTTDLTQGAIDPWHAGGYLNYYYYGQFISATITKLTGVVPEVAYNLIVPMFFAIAAAATFSVVYNLAEATRQLMRRRPGGLPINPAGPLIAGLGGIFLVLLAGNLKAFDVLQTNLSQISPWHSDIPLVGGIVVLVGGFKEVIFGDATLRQVAYSYDWWDSSRALDVIDPAAEVTPITEFPFWTFLFADLHAHLMAIPFAMTAIGLGLALVLNFTRLNVTAAGARTAPAIREWSSWSMVVVLALVVGALRWINSWDYPTFLVLGAAAILIAERAKEGRVNVRMLVMGGAKTFVMAALSFAFFAPFAKNYSTSYGSFSRSDQTTAISDFLSHFGILLFLVAGFVLFALARAIIRDRFMRTLFFGGARRTLPAEVAPVLGAMILAGAMFIWAGSLERWGVIALAVVGLLAVAITALRELRAPSPAAPLLLFVYACIGLGLGLAGGVEVFTLDGDIGRMNTVFKFYIHVWLLWGIAGAYGVWYVLAVMQPQAAFLRRLSEANRTLVQAPRYAFAGVVVLFLAMALVFPYFGTRGRIHDRFDPAQGTGNDGMAYMDATIYRDRNDATGKGGEHVLKYERDAITWLRENVDGTPTTLEGRTDLYHYGSRMAIYTGLPTVLGWDHHQRQQRSVFPETVEQRKLDVDTFYATDDMSFARDVIAKYDVEWVIVGSVERNWYPASGMTKFETGLGGRLELAYENPGVQIWHVIPESELDTPSATAR